MNIGRYIVPYERAFCGLNQAVIMNNEFQHFVTSYCYEYVVLVGFGDEET